MTYANPNPRYFPPTKEWHPTWDVGARATWIIDRRVREFVRFARTRREREGHDRTGGGTFLGGVANEVLIASLDLSRARATVDKQRVALAAAEEGYRVTTDRFKAGRATSTDLIESESQLLEAKLGDVNARIDVAVAAIALRHATGRDIPQSGPTAKNFDSRRVLILVLTPPGACFATAPPPGVPQRWTENSLRSERRNGPSPIHGFCYRERSSLAEGGGGSGREASRRGQGPR